MATFEVTAPDGSVYEVNAPDGATEEQVLSYAKSKFSSQQKPAMEHTQYQRVKPVQPMGNPLDFIRGLGQGFEEPVRGFEQRAAEFRSLRNQDAVADRDRLYAEEEARREKREFDPSVTKAERLGRGTGMFASTLPFAFVPSGQTAVSSTLMSLLAGAGAGSTIPATSTTEAMTNIGTGAGGQALGNLFGRAILPTTSRNMTQAQKDILDAANKEGIPLRTSEATGSRVIRNWESMRSNRPITGSMEERFNTRQTEAINRAITRKLGREIPEVNSAELQQFSNDIGGQVSGMVKGRNVPLDTDFFNAIVDVDSAAGVGGKLTYSPEIKRTVDNALDLITSKQPQAIKGEEAQAIRSLLQDRARDARAADNSELASALEKIVSGLKKAMTSTMSDAEKSAWAQANRMYSNYKLVEEAFIKDPKSLALGDVPINKLARTMEQTRPRSYVHGKGDFAELAKLGQVIRPPGQNALLGEQAVPVVRNAMDVAHGAAYPVIQSRLMQQYLTGSLPGQRLIRDIPGGANTLDALLRAGGLTYFADEDSFK